MLTELASATVEAMPSAVSFFALNYLMLMTAPKHVDKPTAAYWAASAVSIIHSLIIVPLAYMAMGPFWFSDDLQLSTPASNRAIDVFVGYIMADSIPLLRHRKEWAGSDVYIWHHATAFVVWGLMGVRGHGHAVAVGLLLCEATAPFVNARWFLSMLNRKEGLLYMVNGGLMAVSFFVLRIVMMGWLLFRNGIYLHAKFFSLPFSTVAVVIAGCGIGYPMQIFWFHKIACGLLKVLKGEGASASKSEHKSIKAHGAHPQLDQADAFPVGESTPEYTARRQPKTGAQLANDRKKQQ